MARMSQLRLLRYEDLIEANVIRNRTTLRRWMNRAEDPFPQPIVLGTGPRAAIAWRADEVEAWIKRRKRAQTTKKSDCAGTTS